VSTTLLNVPIPEHAWAVPPLAQPPGRDLSTVAASAAPCGCSSSAPWHGPRILIEYDVQEPLTSQGGHVHGITRDPTNDYGMDWLGLHYQESSR